MSAQDTVHEIFALFNASEHILYSEAVSQRAHALQSAQLALDAGSADELVLGALLHDIGHLCDGNARPHDETAIDAVHESVGAHFLRQRGFSERVAQLVEGHVQAKRYLTCTNATYFAQLSPVSRKTLQLQGGPFTPAEAARFAQDPLFKEKLRIRAWDEQAKRPGLPTLPLAAYQDMLVRHLS